LPADAAGNRQQPEHDGGLPAADGRARAVPQRDETQRRAAESAASPTASRRARARPATLPLLSAPELRIDQLSGLPAILAPERAARPDSFNLPKSEPKGPENCPFCEGREDHTPPEVYATRPGGGDADSPGWTTRVVPNLYPALANDGGGSGGAAGA